MGRHLQEKFDHLVEVLRKARRDFRVDASQDLFVEALHIFSSERRFQSDGFIENAPQGPNVAFLIIRLISPNFRTGIVRRPSLSVQ